MLSLSFSATDLDVFWMVVVAIANAIGTRKHAIFSSTFW